MAATAKEVFEREFLPLRGKLIEVAAALDRIARAEGSAEDDPRMRQIREILQTLCSTTEGVDRTERIQMLLSLPYDPQWREHFARR